MKKLATILLSAVLALSFAGCAKNADNSTAPKAEQKPDTQTATTDALSIYNQGVATIANGTQCLTCKGTINVKAKVLEQEQEMPMNVDMQVSSGDVTKMSMNVQMTLLGQAIETSVFCDGENVYSYSPLIQKTVKAPLDESTKAQLKEQQNIGVFDLSGCKTKEQNVKDNGDGTKTLSFTIDSSSITEEVAKKLESKASSDTNASASATPTVKIDDIKCDAIVDSNNHITNLKMTCAFGATGEDATQNVSSSMDVNFDYTYPQTLDIQPPANMDIAHATTANN